MLTIRRDQEIHREEGGWFTARWHFSFAHYRDPENRGIGPLRVFNDDRLVPGAVWPLHPHRDVEGLTYVVEGLFRHEDSLGNNGVLQPGAIQRMTLGSGAQHSEQNGSSDEPMRFLQWWILPDTPSLPPEVEQRQFTTADRTDRLLRVVGPEGGEVVKVHQDASAHVAYLNPDVEVSHEFAEGRGGYVYLIDGEASFGDEKVTTGDAAKAFGPHNLRMRALEPSELILVDVPLEYRRVGVWAAG